MSDKRPASLTCSRTTQPQALAVACSHPSPTRWLWFIGADSQRSAPLASIGRPVRRQNLRVATSRRGSNQITVATGCRVEGRARVGSRAGCSHPGTRVGMPCVATGCWWPGTAAVRSGDSGLHVWWLPRRPRTSSHGLGGCGPRARRRRRGLRRTGESAMACHSCGPPQFVDEVRGPYSDPGDARSPRVFQKSAGPGRQPVC